MHDEKEDRFLAPASPELRDILRIRGIPFEARTVLDPAQANPEKLAQLEAVKRWFNDDWRRIEPKLRTSIVEGVSVFLSLFDDNSKVKKVFCPKKECYDSQKNADNRFGNPLPSFSWLIEHGSVCALNFPIGMNAGLAKALGVMMKLDFERAVLNRVPEIEAHPEQYFRQVLFLCDEYQHFATVGESDPTGDEKFFSLSRQPKCIPIIATQRISSLKSALPGDSWRTLLQTFRLPGFSNRKLSEEFIVQARQETNTVYTLRDFTLSEDSPETPRHLGHDEDRPRTMPSGHKSQSEHDWAYAKRALARGDDPEVLIQRITDYRAEDKADPNYYARRTVARAQAQLTSERQNPATCAVSESPPADKEPDH